jgi:NSS family neurotransmitter:Na+ symporter
MSGVKNGIEKFSKILLPIRLILMLALIARAVTFPGGWEGVKYFLIPDFSKLTIAMLLEALGLGFFTLSLAMGIIITYGSYTPNKINLFNSAKWTALLTVFACFLAGLVVLPTVFAFGFDPAAGPGLVFIVMPIIFGHMPLGLLFAILFFIVLYVAAQLSAVAISEVITSFFIDEFHMKRHYAALSTAAVIFPVCIPVSLSLGIWSGAEYQLFGKTLFDLADYLTFSIMLPIGGMLLSIFTGWVAWDKLEDNLIGEGSRPIWLPLFKNGLRFVAPLLILLILVQSNWPIF